MGLGGVGGGGPEGPPNVTEGAGQAAPLTGCLGPIHLIYLKRATSGCQSAALGPTCVGGACVTGTREQGCPLDKMWRTGQDGATFRSAAALSLGQVPRKPNRRNGIRPKEPARSS